MRNKMQIDYPIESSCQCGQVTYKLFEPPKRVVACHCKECQKLATSPFSVTAIIADLPLRGWLSSDTYYLVIICIFSQFAVFS